MVVSCFVLATPTLALQGCKADLSDLEKKVLERDPGFQSTIDIRDSMVTDLEQARREHNEKKRRLEAQIAALREELSRSRGDYSGRVERIKKRLDPEITALENEIKEMRRFLSVKNSEIRVLDKSISEIQDLVERGKNLEMTQEEMRVWNERMTALVRKRENAIKERNKMSENIETSVMKVRIMRRR